MTAASEIAELITRVKQRHEGSVLATDWEHCDALHCELARALEAAAGEIEELRRQKLAILQSVQAALNNVGYVSDHERDKLRLIGALRGTLDDGGYIELAKQDEEEFEALHQAIAEKDAALRPFARFPDRPNAPDNEIASTFAWIGDETFEQDESLYQEEEATLSVGDLRRARRALGGSDK